MSYHAADAPRSATIDLPGAEPGKRLLARVRDIFVPASRSGLTGARDPIDLARAIGAARRRRGELIDRDLFAEPAWDLLLELYVATREEAEMPVATAAMAASVPTSVSLRWIKELETRGLVSRRFPGEPDREHLVLTQKGLQKMETLLREMLAT